jgi:hypothetical protein
MCKKKCPECTLSKEIKCGNVNCTSVKMMKEPCKECEKMEAFLEAKRNRIQEYQSLKAKPGSKQAL